MRSRVFLALVPLLLALAAPARAEHDGETLDRILPEIRASHPGRMSDAQPWIDDTGATHYRIKWMTPEGRILFFDADPRTGRFFSFPGDESGPWRGGVRIPRVEPSGNDNRPVPDDRGRRHENWNGGSSAWPGGDWRGGGDWRDHTGGGDWRGGRDGGDNGGGRHGHGGN